MNTSHQTKIKHGSKWLNYMHKKEARFHDIYMTDRPSTIISAFVFLDLANVILVYEPNLFISLTRYPREVIDGVLDFQVIALTNNVLSDLLKDQKPTITQPLDSLAFNIYSCLDDQLGANERVHLPHEALDWASWTLLWTCFVSISLITPFLFGRRKSKTTKKTNWIKSIAGSFFVFFSYLLLNPCTNVVKSLHSRRTSVRLLMSGWLLGATLLLYLCYLCNMKGEMATGKTLLYIDSIEDIFNRRDIKEYNAPDVIFDEEYKPLWTLETKKFLKKAKGKNIDKINRKSVYFAPPFYLPTIRYNSRDCDNVYRGNKDINPMEAYLYLSANLPFSILETIQYRVSRFMDTRQERPYQIYFDFNYCRMNETDSNIPPKAIALFFLMPIFRVWFCGMAFSIVAFCLEIAHRRYIEKRENL